jgi:DNA-binding transcriptional ArsR family regulator
MTAPLSKRNLVLIMVRTKEQKNGNLGMGFNELVLALKGKVSRATVSKALDSLFDMGMLDSNWRKGDKWQKKITVSNEAKELVDQMIADLKERKLIK